MAVLQPLAARIRPKSLAEIIGQSHLVGGGAPLYKMAKLGTIHSFILWGPAGCGKTSIASALAKEIKGAFERIDATSTGVKELRNLIKLAEDRATANVETIVFIDEIHRWSKSQQDVMLPPIEDGRIKVIGATTEKPKFAVNSTILSRLLVFEVKPLSPIEMAQLLLKVIKTYPHTIHMTQEASKLLITRCSGDARKLINVSELIFSVLADSGFNIDVDVVNEAIPDKHISFDASGNEHYDYAHAYQESIQHSDGNAAIYWLAQWLSSGEDPAYIARRMLITAFEDCASNQFAITSAVGATFATERTGLPECMIPMAHATVVMAQSKRDKTAHDAILSAMADVKNGHTVYVPEHLRAGTKGYTSTVTKKYIDYTITDPTSLMTDLEFGVNY